MGARGPGMTEAERAQVADRIAIDMQKFHLTRGKPPCIQLARASRMSDFNAGGALKQVHRML